MQTVWFSPTGYVTGDPTLRIGYPSVFHPGAIVTCSSPGDLKWVSIGIPLPQGVAIEEVTVCYQLSNSQSFISQVRLVEMSTPNQALVRHDDPTHLKSTSATCYSSKVAALTPSAAMVVELRLNFTNTADEVSLGAVGITLQRSAGCCVASIADLRALDAGACSCLTLRGYYAPGDGGGGQFYWDATTGDPDNGGTIITPASNPPTGRWKRLVEGSLCVRWFGAKGDGLTDDAPAIHSAVNAALNVATKTYGAGVVFFPKGLYLMNSGITMPAAVTLIGEGNQAGGINDLATNCAAILHNFSGDLFTFTGENGVGPGSGGGVERLRIVQVFGMKGGPAAGSAIVLKAVNNTSRPSWIKLRLLLIEEAAKSPWTWAINIDGSAFNVKDDTGIPDLFIGEVSTHTGTDSDPTNNLGALQLKAASGVQVYNCAFFVNGRVVVTGADPSVPSYSVQLVDVIAASRDATKNPALFIDYAWDTCVIGGIYSGVKATANAQGTSTLLPGRLAGPFVDGSSAACGMLRYDPSGMGGFEGFRLSRPALMEKQVVLSNSNWIYSMNAAGNAALALFGLDVDNAARLVLGGDALLCIGQTPGGIGSPAPPDIVLGVDNAQSKHHVAIRTMNEALSASLSIIATDAADNLQLGQDAAGIQLNNKLGFYGTAPISKGTVTGSRGGNAALTSLLA